METRLEPRVAPTSSQRLRVLVLTDTAILGLGGSEGFLRRLVSRLPPDRFQFDVLQLAHEIPPEKAMARSLGPSVRLHHSPVRAIYGRDGIAAWRYVRRLIRDGNYDVVQSQHEKSDLIAALLPQTSRPYLRISNRRDMGFHKSRKLRWLMRHLNRRFDRIIAPSAAILEALVREDGVDPDRCLCIRNGVDTERFAPADDQRRSALRTQLGFTADHLVIGCAARFWAVKRHTDLIQAFADVHAREPRARLALIGDGPERPEIERLIAKLGLGDCVSILGARTDVDHILPALDVFALVSSSEGLSNAILEAQACGLPVVATNVGGNPELVDQDNGVLVPAHDPQAVAEAILALLGDSALRARMGTKARARVQQEHSLAAMLRVYEAMYVEANRVR